MVRYIGGLAKIAKDIGQNDIVLEYDCSADAIIKYIAPKYKTVHCNRFSKGMSKQALKKIAVISDMCRLFETKEQRRKHADKYYNEVLAKNEVEQMPIILTIYVYSVIPVANNLHIIPTSSILSKIDGKLERSCLNTERTEEEQEHCIHVPLARTKNTICNIKCSHKLVEQINHKI